MSVINQMLKELDERKKDPHSVPQQANISSGMYSSAQSVSPLKVIGLISFIIFVAVLITTAVIYKFDLLNTDATDNSSSLQQPSLSDASKSSDTAQPSVVDKTTNQVTASGEVDDEVGEEASSGVVEETSKDQSQSEASSSESSVVNNEAENKTESINESSNEIIGESSVESKPLSAASSIVGTSVVESDAKSAIETTADKNHSAEQVTSDKTTDASEPVVEATASSIIKSKPKLSLKAQSQALYHSAKAEVDLAQLQKAKLSLTQSLELDNNNHQARLLLLSIWLGEANYSTMESSLDSALNQWPKVHQYRQIKARLLMATEHQQEALVVLQSDIPNVTEAQEYHALLAYVAQQLSNDELASMHYQLLLGTDNTRADWWLGIAVSQERLGNQQIALQAYQQSISHPGLTESVKQYARQRITALQGY